MRYVSEDREVHTLDDCVPPPASSRQCFRESQRSRLPYNRSPRIAYLVTSCLCRSSVTTNESRLRVSSAARGNLVSALIFDGPHEFDDPCSGC